MQMKTLKPRVQLDRTQPAPAYLMSASRNSGTFRLPDSAEPGSKGARSNPPDIESTALDTILDQALDDLWMAFQPLVSWEARSVVAYEALMRSREPALPHPGAILDAAERLDRLTEVGLVVRERIAAQIPEAPAGDIFINLHAADLMCHHLYEPSAPLSAHAGRIVLELTERSALDRVPDCRARIRALRQLGFRIAIDDLGAGYAGLSSFALLEPEFVKFDMSLVREVHREPLKQRLIRAFTEVCTDMGIRVVAEGVETAEECSALIDLGCDLLQGFYFSRPAAGFPSVTF